MSNFWATLAGAFVGGGVAVLGQWRLQAGMFRQRLKTDWKLQQHATITECQTALKNAWVRFVAPDVESTEGDLYWGMPIFDAKLLASRLHDRSLAGAIDTWLAKINKAAKRDPSEAEVGELQSEWKTLNSRLADLYRTAYPQ
ncbi:hypothetical protein [Kitasatospora sp. NPDC050543]|uniref:hypothetical protein n=1 Tax=Kitasatospora sp. NPDC050543 TaxID=3364054 RepID=UPI00378864BF